MRLEVGDEVTLILAEPLRTASGMLPRLKRFHLSGIFEAGVQEYDSSAAFVNLEDAARVFRGHGVQGLHVHLSDAFAGPTLRERLVGRAEFKALRITDWTQTHANLFRALATEKILMFIILLLSVGVAAFNLVSTLVMVVADRLLPTRPRRGERCGEAPHVIIGGGMAREVVNRVQKMRKKAGLQATDPVEVFIHIPAVQGMRKA